MKSFYKLLLFTILMAVSQLLLAKQSIDTVTLQLKWKHQFQFAGFYAAINNGYYKEAGLHVVLKEGNTGIDFVNEVISGNADYGLEAPELIIDRNNGIPVVAIAAIFQHSPEVLIARKESNIKLISDFKGKEISIGKNGLASTRALLMKYGIREMYPDKLTSTTLVDDLINNRTDIIASYITDAPYIINKAGVEEVIFKPRSYGIDMYGDILFTSETKIHKDKKEVEKFVEASVKGWIYAMDHKEELIDLIIEEYNPNLPKNLLLYEATVMEDLIMPKLVEPGHMNAERWKHIGDTFVQLGQLQPLYSIDGFLLDDYILFNRKRKEVILYILLGFGILSIFSLLFFYVFNRRLKKAVIQHTDQLTLSNSSLKNEILNRKIAHANLLLSEERFKQLFEDSPISLWEEDCSAIKKMLDQLVRSGEKDVENYIRSNPDFVAECAKKIRIIDINKATLQYMEADSKEHLINNLDKLFTKKALSDFANQVLKFFNGEQIFEAESEHVTLKGNKIYVSLTVKIPRGYEKTWSKVIVSLIDISDLKNTTDELKDKEILLLQQNEALKGINVELKKAKKRAEESDHLKTAFLSNMSHEIRTPMNGIIGFTDLLKDDSLPNDERGKYLKIIEDNSQQLLRIISDIIDISKIEASQLNIVINDTDVRQLFMTLNEMFNYRISRLNNNQLNCQYTIHKDFPKDFVLKTDGTRLKQILINLLENAVKFTEKGHIELGVCPSDEPDMIVFYVKDTGLGIKEDRVKQIFDRFFREEERFGANLGGTGLGLSIAKNLVELLGGTINVESQTDKGSTFFFTHPYKH